MLIGGQGEHGERLWRRGSNVQAVGNLADCAVITLVMVGIEIRLVGEQRCLPENEQ